MQIFAMKKILENFGTYLSVLTFVVLCVGFINLKVYYSNFNIDIEDYITASELIILSIPTLFKILTYLLFPGLILILFIKDFDKYRAKNLPLDKWMIQKKIAYPLVFSFVLIVLLSLLAIFNLPDNLRALKQALLKVFQ